ADNQMIGAINLAGIDRGNTAEYVFAQKLLDEAAGKIQRVLFKQRFRDAMIVSVSGLDEYALTPSNQLVAIDEAGIILGATAKAHQLARKAAPAELLGKSFEMMFDTDIGAIDRVLSTRSETKRALSMSPKLSNLAVYPGRGWQPSPQKKLAKLTRRRLSPTLRLLAMGSETMAAVLEQARAHFERALPFIIEGESGTGKSALIEALHSAAHLTPSQMVMVDCSLLDHRIGGQDYSGAIFEQARVIGALHNADRHSATVILENIDEMPGHDQSRVRNLMTALEAYDGGLDPALPSSALRIVATCRKPLKDAVELGCFRDDLYFLISNARFELPPLRMRERPEDLAQALASQLAGTDVDITDEAIDAIRHHEWPGNIRELRGALRQALVAGDGRRISLLDLRASSAFSGSRYRLPASGAKRPAASCRSYDEKTMLLDALRGSGWNVSRAARTLGIGRATIHRKMKRHGIIRPGLSKQTSTTSPS
ncbi:MAG: sigma 54-interacting transcriptional regulator, partial [Pseudomonadota bacterium]